MPAARAGEEEENDANPADELEVISDEEDNALGEVKGMTKKINSVKEALPILLHV